jgi:hypothetical protein
MGMLLDNAASQRKLFSVVCVFSMLMVSVAFGNESLCKAEPKHAVVESLQPSAADQDATFEKVWVEYDIRVDGKKGMRIHAKFTVKNSLNVSCRLIAQFYRRDSSYLTSDGDPAYTTSEGHVYTYVDLKPRFNSTRYEDKTLFIPYEAFNIKARGQYLLKFVLFLDRNAQTIGHSADFNFKYTKDTL